MLTFTFRNDRVAGTFNGRFAFRAPMQVDPLSLAALEAIANGQEAALEADVLRHEFLHWVTFRASSFGIETVGRRFRTRSEFLKGNSDEVVSYYQQRTAYFCCAYIAHEDVVDGRFESCKGMTLTELRENSLSSDQIEKVSLADQQAKLATKSLGALSNPLIRKVDFAKGYLATREYGLQNYIPDKNVGKRIREVALASGSKGVLNAAFETEIGEQSTLVGVVKSLRRKINTEGRLGGLSKEKMGMWSALKFTTEAKTLINLRRRGYPVPVSSFHQYAEDVVNFVFRYILSKPDKILARNLRQLLLDCQIEDPCIKKYAELTRRFSEFEEGILYYFYIHGN